MEQEFLKYIEDRKEFYDKLKDIQLHKIVKSQPIKLGGKFFKDLILDTDFSNQIKKKHNPNFQEIANYKGAAVYWFRIEQSGEKEIEELIDCFKNQKTERKDLAFSKPPKNAKTTNYLYLGKVESNLYGRFIQHLGLGAKKTYALRLCEWISCDLVFEFIKLEDVDKKYLEDIENFFWRRYNLLIGKEPNIKE